MPNPIFPNMLSRYEIRTKDNYTNALPQSDTTNSVYIAAHCPAETIQGVAVLSVGCEAYG
jgi:hypothetical protein